MRAAPPAARNDDLSVPRRMRANAPPTNEVATQSTQATGSGQWISQVMARSARRSAKDLWDMTQSYTGMTIAYMTRMTFKNATIALLSALAIPACVAADQTEADVLDDDISEPIAAVGAADASTCVLDERMEIAPAALHSIAASSTRTTKSRPTGTRYAGARIMFGLLKSTMFALSYLTKPSKLKMTIMNG